MNSVDLSLADSNVGVRFQTSPGEPGFALWWRQFIAVMVTAIAKSLFSKRVFVALVLCALPVVFITIIGFIPSDDGGSIIGNANRSRMVFAFIYSTFILGAVLYLGNALMFTSLVRGEILDRSIHYPLLAPVRREILVLGRFAGGLISASLLFGIATIVCYLLMYLPFGMTRLTTDLSGGVALQQMSIYVLMTFLACMGYGSVFMATGLVFRNPLIPVLAIAGWEFFNFLLPPALKLISVVYYLKNLTPVFIDQGPIPLAVVASPLPMWMSIMGIVVLTVISITIAVIYLRRMEIRYTED